MMRHGPEKHNRHSIRLKGYDYARDGAYFVTICIHDRACLFGDVVHGEMRLNGAGRLVSETWRGLPDHYPHLELDAWVVMPNHVHGIVVLVGAGFVRATSVGARVGAGLKPAPTMPAPTLPRHGLSEIVRAFKTFSARRINEMRGTPGTPVWQRNFYEHIIRNDGSFSRIRQYIMNNPAEWAEDAENPARVRAGFKPAPAAPTI